jgi:RNA polymerase sigma factor (sigma-70 family)
VHDQMDVHDPIQIAVTVHGEPAADDATLIRRSWQEPNCFGELFRRHASQLHRYVARRLGRLMADDIVAETFYLAFRGRHRYDVSLADARPWLWRIAANLMHRHWRSEKRMLRALARTGLDPVLDDRTDQVEAQVAAWGARRQLAAALARLPARDRDVLLLVAWGELTYAEVAQVLEIPVGTVRSRLSRSRHKLRAALGGVDPSSTCEETERG